jgi:hypothetical protein
MSEIARFDFILVDTLGLLLHALVSGADVQDRDGGILLLSQYIQCWARLGARSHPTLVTRPRKLRDVSPVRR